MYRYIVDAATTDLSGFIFISGGLSEFKIRETYSGASKTDEIAGVSRTSLS
jgi:hypothetical protein